MADRSAQLLLAALSRAAVEPGGLPLIAGRGQPGLFVASAAGRQAAQRCRDDGLLDPVSDKTASPNYRLSEKGLNLLLESVPPKELLEDFLRVLEARQAQAVELTTTARRMQGSLDAMRDCLTRLLNPPQSAAPIDLDAGAERVLDTLRRRPASGGDCPLPELYRLINAVAPLSIGQFHDALRRLDETSRVYLHPWTGPLYDLPEPPFALLIGHLVAYYASPRT